MKATNPIAPNIKSAFVVWLIAFVGCAVVVIFEFGDFELVSKILI